jgi:hypothetical protein
MIGVAQQDFDAERLEIPVRDALDGALRADGHESRSLNGSVRRVQPPSAGGTISGQKLERETGIAHAFSGYFGTEALLLISFVP